tara:strand:- start:126 stop:593 length:468 start_codon:yes stop_codon:yes gene_type:complete
MKTKKIITAITLCFYTLCTVPTIAYAGEPEQKITTLRRGQPAPYSGTLFNTAAAARLQVDLKFTEESCNIETDRQLGLLRSKLQLDIDLLKAQLESQQQLHQDVLLIKNDQIKFLENYSLETKWHESNEFWLVTGLVAGIAVTAIAGWSLGQANN